MSNSNQFYNQSGQYQHHHHQQQQYQQPTTTNYYESQDSSYSQQPQQPLPSHPQFNTIQQPLATSTNQYYSSPPADQSPYQQQTAYNPQDVATKPPYEQSERAHIPSPQPEQQLLQTKQNSQVQYKKVNYKRFVKEKKYIPWWIVLVLILVLVILMTVYHKRIVHWLQPVSQRCRELSWGWVIPILILIAISFPPLFGHEIVIVLVGVVYGLWEGFGIAAAGTVLGEIATWFAFKGFLRKHADKLEKKNLDYGALARITRQGGFPIVFVVRLSAVPSHFTTAVFATCGVSFWAFLIATIITLPKQLVIVYLGVIINNPSSGKTVSDIVLGITFLITILAAVYIWWKLKKEREVMLADGTTEIVDDTDLQTMPSAKNIPTNSQFVHTTSDNMSYDQRTQVDNRV